MTVTKKTEHVGYENPTGPGSDKSMAPQRPYTGDGRTTRQIFDKPKLDSPPKK